MPEHLIRKLERFERLSRADRQAIVAASQDIRKFGARKQVDPIDGAWVFLSGLACHYQIVEDGTRQITNFIVPGDFCDVNPALQDWAISTLSPCTAAPISRDQLDELLAQPRIARALWHAAAADAAALREWSANIGRRPADRRVASLLCELCLRLNAAGDSKVPGCVLPLSQIDLADATALSSVHINRVLGRLRDRRLLTPQRRSIIIKDIRRMMTFAQFNGAYLQLQGIDCA